MERAVEESTTEQERRSQKMKILDSYLNELDELGIEYLLSIENKFTNRSGTDPFERVYWLHINSICERFKAEGSLVRYLVKVIATKTGCVSRKDVLKEFEEKLDSKYISVSEMLAREYPKQYEEATIEYIERNFDKISENVYRRKPNE